MKILLIFLSFALISGVGGVAADVATTSQHTDSSAALIGQIAPQAEPPAPTPQGKKKASAVCEALKTYPRPEGTKLSFESGDVSAICRPFVKLKRHQLDRCGDVEKDPYTSAVSHERDVMNSFTWASRSEMSRRGKINLFTDSEAQAQREPLMKRINELKASAGKFCCGDDLSCQKAFEQVDVSLCKPQDDPDAPDPCVFGGSYKMPGDGYSAIFQAIHKLYGAEEAADFKRLVEKNLGPQNLAKESVPNITRGNIVLSSYVSRSSGVAALEPVVLHELGHACSMIRMQEASLTPSLPTGKRADKAVRAARWLDSARKRCQSDFELPEAYYDFWESLGESKKLAQCLEHLTYLNQKQKIDQPCSGLCPGHYLEESVGIAFSLLAGDVRGHTMSVFPNTCDHVRDGQHPMVSDVAECLTQHSPRFREKLKRAHDCES